MDPSRQGKRSLEAAGDAAAAACVPSRRGMRRGGGGGGGNRGPTTKQPVPKMNSSDPKQRSHEQTVADESLCALKGNMRASACVRAFIPQSDAL